MSIKRGTTNRRSRSGESGRVLNLLLRTLVVVWLMVVGSTGAMAQSAVVNITPVEVGPVTCDTPVTLTVGLVPELTTAPYRGYSIQLMVLGSAVMNPADFLINEVPAGQEYWYGAQESSPGVVVVDYAILGPTPGITETVDLFEFTVSGTSDGTAAIIIASVLLRDLDNDSVPVSTGTFSQITFDCTPPMAPNELTAMPGHEQVTLTWTWPNPLFENDAVELEVFRSIWASGNATGSAYPLYDDDPLVIEQTLPNSYQDAVISPWWISAGTVVQGVTTFTDFFLDTGPLRGIYHYEVFARDPAGNYSGLTYDQARATNYVLGDVYDPVDGVVSVADISVLGSTFGRPFDDPLYVAEADVGPTHNNHADGLPLTDLQVNFEDLMIFAVNFITGLPGKTGGAGVGPAIFAWSQEADGQWTLSLVETGGDLKGLSVSFPISAGVEVPVQQGEALDLQETPVFLKAHHLGGYHIDLAVLGRGQAFENTGTLFTVDLPPGTDSGAISIDARGTDNQPVVWSLTQEATPAVPGAYSLAQNYPNPFNPTTTIAFDLPGNQIVKLVIFDAEGHLVRTLVNELMPAGRHQVTWNGRDERNAQAASGVYFSRIESGNFKQTRKMLLIK